MSHGEGLGLTKGGQAEGFGHGCQHHGVGGCTYCRAGEEPLPGFLKFNYRPPGI